MRQPEGFADRRSWNTLAAKKSACSMSMASTVAASLEKDLLLATAVLGDDGIIILDDMLHPGYPTLMVTVHEYLQSHPEMVVLCIIDRETIVGATKFVLCRADWFKRYETELLRVFEKNVWPLGADFEPHWCLVLSLDTRLAAIT